MLAILFNLGMQELTLIAVVAVLIFGRRLPEVAAQAYAQVARARQALEDLRRETGIDRELRNIEHEVRDAARRGKIENPMQPPQGLRQAWDAEEAERRKNQQAADAAKDSARNGNPEFPAASEATGSEDDFASTAGTSSENVDSGDAEAPGEEITEDPLLDDTIDRREHS